MGTPHGLIRYDTENGMARQLTRVQRWRRILRPRVLIYGGLLLVLSTGVLWSLAHRHAVRVDVVRDRATLARQVEDGWIENVYRLQLMNATEAPQQLKLEVDGLPGLQLSQAASVTLGPAEARWVTVALRMPPEAVQNLKPGAQPMRWLVHSASGESVAEKSTFVVPR